MMNFHPCLCLTNHARFMIYFFYTNANVNKIFKMIIVKKYFLLKELLTVL